MKPQRSMVICLAGLSVAALLTHRSAQASAGTWRATSVLSVEISAPTDDPDLDGLTNYEESMLGTDPNNSDTDGGGENDGSEVHLFSLDPFDPSDDQIEGLGWVYGYSRPRASLLHFDVKSEYSRLRLYRRTSHAKMYSIADDAVSPTGWYLDTGLTNGVMYSYRLVAYDLDGHASAVTDPVVVVPHAMMRYFPLIRR